MRLRLPQSPAWIGLGLSLAKRLYLSYGIIQDLMGLYHTIQDHTVPHKTYMGPYGTKHGQFFLFVVASIAINNLVKPVNMNMSCHACNA